MFIEKFNAELSDLLPKKEKSGKLIEEVDMVILDKIKEARLKNENIKPKDVEMAEKISGKFYELVKNLKGNREGLEKYQQGGVGTASAEIIVSKGTRTERSDADWFTKDGETEFYKTLGILSESEKEFDIEAIRQKIGKDKNEIGEISEYTNSDNFKVSFPTNIDGIKLNIEKKEVVFEKPAEMGGGHGSRSEEKISLSLANETLEEIAAEKKAENRV